MFILIDNYDSFTWNLWHYLSDLEVQVEVIRNDARTAEEIIGLEPQGLIISPGPGVPENAGISTELIRSAKENNTPLLGVCLGHQALSVAFGGKVCRIDPPVHGKLSQIVKTSPNIAKSDILSLCPEKFPATRYHSLVVDESYLPNELFVTARTESGTIMGLSHKHAELHGVQFHPESIASVSGYRILASFIEICGHSNNSMQKLNELESQIIRLDKRFPGQMLP